MEESPKEIPEGFQKNFLGGSSEEIHAEVSAGTPLEAFSSRIPEENSRYGIPGVNRRRNFLWTTMNESLDKSAGGNSGVLSPLVH